MIEYLQKYENSTEISNTMVEGITNSIKNLNEFRKGIEERLS